MKNTVEEKKEDEKKRKKEGRKQERAEAPFPPFPFKGWALGRLGLRSFGNLNAGAAI